MLLSSSVWMPSIYSTSRKLPVRRPALRVQTSVKAVAHLLDASSSCKAASRSNVVSSTGAPGYPRRAHFPEHVLTLFGVPIDDPPNISFRRCGVRSTCNTPDPDAVAGATAAALQHRSQAATRHDAAELHWPELRIRAAWPS